MSKLKQILIILIIAAGLGLIVNAINPKGIPLILEKNIYKLDTVSQKKNIGDFVNDPFDTTSNNQAAQISNAKRKVNKEGFVEPENISENIAKIFFDKNALFIDARTKLEYDSLHIKGAINIPYNEFHNKPVPERAEVLRKYNKNGIIVVYCNGGKCEVSIDLAYDIARLGFNSVNIYRGGILEWKNSGYPVEP